MKLKFWKNINKNFGSKKFKLIIKKIYPFKVLNRCYCKKFRGCFFANSILINDYIFYVVVCAQWLGVNSESIVFALPIDNVCVSNVAQITRWPKPNLPQIRKLNFFIYLTSYKSNIYNILSLKSVPERNFQRIRSISH